jgi:hypothetical protein
MLADFRRIETGPWSDLSGKPGKALGHRARFPELPNSNANAFA